MGGVQANGEKEEGYKNATAAIQLVCKSEMSVPHDGELDYSWLINISFAQSASPRPNVTSYLLAALCSRVPPQAFRQCPPEQLLPPLRLPLMTVHAFFGHCLNRPDVPEKTRGQCPPYLRP